MKHFVLTSFPDRFELRNIFANFVDNILFRVGPAEIMIWKEHDGTVTVMLTDHRRQHIKNKRVLGSLYFDAYPGIAADLIFFFVSDLEKFRDLASKAYNNKFIKINLKTAYDTTDPEIFLNDTITIWGNRPDISKLPTEVYAN